MTLEAILGYYAALTNLAYRGPLMLSPLSFSPVLTFCTNFSYTLDSCSYFTMGLKIIP